MSARLFIDGMAELLQGESLFIAALAELLGLPIQRIVKSNVPLGNLPTDSLPCWVLEQGEGMAASINNNGDDEGLVIGLSQQQFVSELHCSLIWSEQDREVAGEQRSDLPTLMTQLMLRNPMPGGIPFAQLREWEPDRGVNHPLQVWRATLRGEYAIPRV